MEKWEFVVLRVRETHIECLDWLLSGVEVEFFRYCTVEIYSRNDINRLLTCNWSCSISHPQGGGCDHLLLPLQVMDVGSATILIAKKHADGAGRITVDASAIAKLLSSSQ